MRIASLVLGVSIFLICPQISPAAETSAEENAVRQTANAFVDAYDRGDAAAVAALWTEDGEYTIGNDTVKGRSAIAKLYAEFFRQHPGSKMQVKIGSIRMLAPTVALERGTASVSGRPNEPSSASTYTAIHVKQNGKWLMVGVRDSEAPTVQVDRDLKELAWMVGEWTTSKDAAKVTLFCDWMTNKHFLRAVVIVHGSGGDIPAGTQIIGRDPVTGQILSWFFSADGGYGRGIWNRDGSRWFIQTEGITAIGSPTAATNVLYHADQDVASWQSTNRYLGNTQLPDIKEVVIERATAKK